MTLYLDFSLIFSKDESFNQPVIHKIFIPKYFSYPLSVAPLHQESNFLHLLLLRLFFHSYWARETPPEGINLILNWTMNIFNK